MALPFLCPFSEGAVCVADWGSVLLSIGHSLRHGLRRATSLKEGGKDPAPAIFIVKIFDRNIEKRPIL